MKRLIILLVFLGAGVFVIGSVPCQGADEWTALCHYKAATLAVDSPYIYILVPTADVYRSTDNGSNWQQRKTGLCADCSPDAISIDPTDPDWVFAGYAKWNRQKGPRSPLNPILYRSTDGGSNWTSEDHPQCGMTTGGDIPTIVSNPDDSSKVFYGRSLGAGDCTCPVRRSTDRGDNWATVADDDDLHDDVLSLAFDLDHPDILYAGAEDSGVYKTTNSSAGNPSWSLTGLTQQEVRSIVVNPNNTSILFAATTDDVYKTTDGGTNWSRIAGDHDYTFNSLAINPKHPNFLYALRDDDHVYFYYDGRSTDWVDMGSGLASDDINQLASDLGAPGSKVVYAASDSGVYKHDEEESKDFIRGDAKADDGSVNVVDWVFLNNYLQGGETPPCMDAADVNDDGAVNYTDLLYLTNFLFRSGPAPPKPYGTFPDSCGADPNADDLNCIYSPCYGQ